MKGERPMRILVVDNHRLVREALCRIVQAQPDMEIAGEASNGLAAVEIYALVDPDVTLIDLSMPEMDGIEAIKTIRMRYPQSRFVVLSAFDFVEDISKSFEAGASAYLTKDTKREKLLEVVRGVNRGQTYTPGVLLEQSENTTSLEPWRSR
jgi:DNA-binding NarL/FixJ family response regulator